MPRSSSVYVIVCLSGRAGPDCLRAELYSRASFPEGSAFGGGEIDMPTFNENTQKRRQTTPF